MSTRYGTANCKNAVWNKASKVRGKDPDLYRRDAYGNVMYKPSYGKYSDKGWNIDHIKPQSKGGSHNIRNLQPIKSKMNSKLGNKIVKRGRK